MRKATMMLIAELASAMTLLAGCSSNTADAAQLITGNLNGGTQMTVSINGQTFTAQLYSSQAAAEFAQMMEDGPVTIRMSEYGGFELVGALGRRLTAENSHITTQAGDIVLYQGNQIVMFYGSNSWSYTRLARVNDLTGWAEALSSSTEANVTFSLEK